MAREVAAVLGKECKPLDLSYTKTDVKKDNFSVNVDAQDICQRYISHYVYDVQIKESPAWMRKRLALVGIASISNIVDITNYILKELGQPMHAFDYNYLEGEKINVRRANDGEKIVTLDEKEFELNSNIVEELNDIDSGNLISKNDIVKVIFFSIYYFYILKTEVHLLNA